MQDNDLDDLLAVAAHQRMVPSEELMQRVLVEALALQPQGLAPPLASTSRQAPRGPLSALARLAAAFGGLPALAGLGTAAVFGLALGYYNPATMDYLTGTSADAAEFFPDADFLTTEG